MSHSHQTLTRHAEPISNRSGGGNSVLEFRPEALRAAIQAVCDQTLPLELQRWAEAYGRVGHRDMFLWKWVLEGIRLTALPCVDPALRDHVNITKVLGVILDVLLDDVADRSGDPRYLEKMLRIPFSDEPPSFAEFSPEQRAYAEFTLRVWNEIRSRAATYPRFAEFETLLRFDYAQLLNAMRYSHIINGQVSLLNIVEHDLYLPHNMHMMVSGTLDLMCSPAFDSDECGVVREAVWHGQYMGRVGNLVTTWERELKDRDFSSGVYARALEAGVLTVAKLRSGDAATIRDAVIGGNCEKYFLDRWQDHRVEILRRRPLVRSFDLGLLVAGLERLIQLHLGSRGLK